MSKQLLRCGTSIGANVSESQQAQSKADFISKMSIALKEAYETDYWLRLLHSTQYLQENAYLSMIADCKELQKLLVTIIKTAKK
jgi:four helix bundle protein